MAFPADPLDVLVEMAIGEDPAGDPSSWSWTDITDYVLHRDGIRIQRGKQDRFGSSAPSSLELTVDNTGGRFVVRNPLGAYYPSLRRNVPIRVSIDDVPRFTGFVDQLPVSWDVSGADPHVRLRAFGALKRLARTPATPVSSARRFIEASLPLAYWPLEDGELAVEGAPAGGTRPLQPWSGTHPSGAVVTRAKWGTGSLGPWLPPVFQFPSTNGLSILAGPVEGMTPGLPWVVAFMYAGTAGSGETTLDINPSYLGGITGWPQLIINPAGREILVTFNGEPEVDSLVPQLFDGLGHVIQLSAATSSGTANWTVYVDGVEVQSDSTSGSMSMPVVESVGLVCDSDGGAVIGHLAVWDVHPSETLLARACLGTRDEQAGRRMNRVAFEQGVQFDAAGGGPLVDQAATLDNTQRMGPQPYAPLLAILAEGEEIDGGILAEATTGQLEYLIGRLRYNRDVELALDYEQGHVAPPFEPVDDDADIRNDVTVTRSGGGAARYVDDDHVAAEGRYDEAVTVNASSNAQLPDQASWRVHLGTVPELRHPQLTIKLHRNPDLIDDWLACRLGSRVTVDNPPPELPPDQIDQQIVGYTEAFDSFSWTVTLNLTPNSGYMVGIWEDDVYGRVDTDGSQLAAAINSSTTSISVETTAGEIWTTDSGEFPFDIRVGGEVMTVTAISGGSSPQTFTVTRSVNGVIKAHDDETPVSLAHPMIVGL